MSVYRLTIAASDDLEEIFRYTLDSWGIDQVFAYQDQLESRLSLLAQFPEVGRSNVNLPEHVLYVVEGKHYVFYRITDAGILVLRFLHARVDVLQHLSRYL